MQVDLPPLEGLVVTLIVTAVRTTLEASPTLIGGVVVAAWLRTQATPERIQTLFRGEGAGGVLRSGLIGMCLPVCSIGVLPVLRELRRLGLPTSKLITLGLVAPLLNPISLLYGLTILASLQLLLVFSAAGILALAVGDVTARFTIRSHSTADTRPAGLTGATRLRNLLIASGRIVTGWPLVDLMLVIVISGLASSFIPSGAFNSICDPSNRAGPIIGSLLTLPQYVSPVRGVIQYSALDRVSLSLATGLAVYVMAGCISPATLHQFWRWYGLRRTAALAVAVLLVICTVSYAAAAVLPAPIGAVEDTDGLNGLTLSIHPSLSRITSAIGDSLSLFDALMMVGTAALVALIPTGILIRTVRIGFRDDDPHQAAEASGGRMARAIPASQLGAIALVGIAIFFCVATYIFFPSPTECLEEMQGIRMDTNIAIRSGDVRWAIDRLNAWDASAARLPISTVMRWSFPTAAQQQATRNLRMELRSTQECLQQGDLTTATRKIEDLGQLLSEAKSQFDGTSS